MCNILKYFVAQTTQPWAMERSLRASIMMMKKKKKKLVLLASIFPLLFYNSSSSQMLIPNLKFLCPIHMRQSLDILTQPNSHGGFAHFENNALGKHGLNNRRGE